MSTTFAQIITQLRILNFFVVVCINSYSLYECIIKLRTTKKKRLIIDIIAIRESYEKRELFKESAPLSLKEQTEFRYFINRVFCNCKYFDERYDLTNIYSQSLGSNPAARIFFFFFFVVFIKKKKGLIAAVESFKAVNCKSAFKLNFIGFLKLIISLVLNIRGYIDAAFNVVKQY
ncbi:hypothetical protein MBM_08371 [Drepanopeziza brunnea f. sp. 'multigermtubi' MB_m1]|uniref:Uncharacterized protein n=1 Tax=Marssonina brunnea f. sp. multigermtubi (strain MB_m1) TaxID=1072389 RepID=K1WYI2_MARBU|nr:uncharacterized protein MBM_08371 [Drepanopeziza brunnea f. sp. 'multigermtubi' MB_m1]EKD13653.1 hypothetical protein MBM_08371 [Drepanopeziza brunnea f. sp. 'multigermtubi' MB_m1]